MLTTWWVMDIKGLDRSTFKGVKSLEGTFTAIVVELNEAIITLSSLYYDSSLFLDLSYDSFFQGLSSLNVSSRQHPRMRKEPDSSRSSRYQ